MADAVTISALPLAVNLQLYAGDDFWLDITVTDSLTGAPIDLTGLAPSSHIKARPGADPMAGFTCVIDPVLTHIIHLHLPSSEAVKLTGSAVWDCQLTSAAVPPIVSTLTSGKVTVSAEVTLQ